MKSKDLLQVLKEKHEACVTIIVPTHRLSPGRRTDEPVLKKAIVQATELLNERYSNQISVLLQNRLDELLQTINFTHNKDGLGLYVSASVKEVVVFPLPVKERIIVEESFDLRELVYLNNYDAEYFVLALNEKKAQLFKGSIDELVETGDENFPLQHEDQFQYSKPTRGSSYVGNAFVKEFEKDKSIMEEIRLKEFFTEADQLLKKYLPQHALLLIAATKKDIALFKSVSKHDKNIIGTISGSTSYTDADQLGKLAWLKIWAYINNQMSELILNYEEKRGAGLGVEGITDVWQAAKAGRGLQLLVEKDFAMSAFIQESDNTLHLERPLGNYTTISNAVEDIIQTVMEKGGHVAIFENGHLAKNHRIALITRY